MKTLESVLESYSLTKDLLTDEKFEKFDTASKATEKAVQDLYVAPEKVEEKVYQDPIDSNLNPNYTFDKNKTSANFIMPNLKVNDTLIISSGCPYIKVLNNGSSSQAPKNFIQISVVNTKKYVNKLKIKDIDYVL